MGSIRYLLLVFVVFLVLLVSSGSFNDSKSPPFYPTDIKETSVQQFLLSNKGTKTVALYPEGFESPLRVWHFDEAPTGLGTRGDYAYVTTFETVGEVHILHLQSGEVEKTLTTGSGANTPLISPDGNALYVLNQFQGTVSKIDLNSREVVATVKVLREPRSAVIDKDGRYLFVANFLPAQRADLDTVTAMVSVIDLEGFIKVRDIAMANGSNSLRGIALSPDGKYVFVTHNLARFGVPTNQLTQGWMNTSAMGIIDVGTLEKIATVLLDDPERGAAGIWDVNCTAENIVITHSGTHEISLIDYNGFVEKLNSYPNKNLLNFDLSFMQGIRQRIPLVGNGPRNFVISGNMAFIPTYFSDTLNLVSLTNGQITSVALNPGRLASKIDIGERVFNDASFCFQNWQSCNGCHPGDARADGLNWDLMNDGVGNPKNTKSLLYSHVTPPAMISGIRASAEMAVRAGFTHIQFAKISEDLTKAVDEYLKSLRPVPSPWLANGYLSEKAERGRDVFNRLGCGDCHSGPYYTDLQMYRIGEDVEFENGWDTPTLIEVWRTAPYLFDGRAATMEDVFAVHNHGIYEKLSDKELDELVEFVNSL